MTTQEGPEERKILVFESKLEKLQEKHSKLAAQLFECFYNLEEIHTGLFWLGAPPLTEKIQQDPPETFEQGMANLEKMMSEPSVILCKLKAKK